MSHQAIKILIVATFAVVLVGIVCLRSTHQTSSTTTPTLSFGDTKIALEIAQTEAERQHGLSDRKSLAENAGMLFVFDHELQPNFWMKDMYFPLDIIWLDQDYRIVSYHQNISPDTYPQTFAPSSPVRYVLEVNAGFVDKHGLKEGEQGALTAYN